MKELKVGKEVLFRWGPFYLSGTIIRIGYLIEVMSSRNGAYLVEPERIVLDPVKIHNIKMSMSGNAI